jgi:hypothetical protein
MNKAQLDALRAAFLSTNTQLYSDSETNLGWSWNNYTQDMFNAVVQYSKGDKGNSFQTIRHTQDNNPGAQGKFDLALRLYDEGFYLIMMTAAAGILNWDEIKNIVEGSYTDNLGGLQDANTTWGPDTDGPADLATTLAAFAKLMASTIPADGKRLLFTKEVWGALRGGFNADPVQLFAIVHQYLPVPRD